MIYIQLVWTFFKIGLFSFGGGYAMIPLMQQELELNGWINNQEFADIVAISQMTPGPIAVNAATYIGVTTAGFWGALVATFGITLPSFMLIMLIIKYYTKVKSNQTIEAVLRGIRPVTIGLIGSAVVFFSDMSIFKNTQPFQHIGDIIKGDFSEFIRQIQVEPAAILIFLTALILTKKFKIHPIFVIMCSAVMGIVLL